MKLPTATISVIGAAFMISSPVAAADKAIDVVVSPVELSTEEGAMRVLDRVDLASRHACPPKVYIPRSKVLECREEFAQVVIAQLSQRLNDERFLKLATASGLLGVKQAN